MKLRANPLPGISRDMVEDALASLRDFMNKIEKHYFDTEMAYEHFIMSNDGNALLAVVRNGLRYADLVKDGTIPVDDWVRSKWKEA